MNNNKNHHRKQIKPPFQNGCQQWNIADESSTWWHQLDLWKSALNTLENSIACWQADKMTISQLNGTVGSFFFCYIWFKQILHKQCMKSGTTQELVWCSPVVRHFLASKKGARYQINKKFDFLGCFLCCVCFSIYNFSRVRMKMNW